MPNPRHMTSCSLDEAFEYFDNLYIEKIKNSSKEFDAYYFDIALNTFIAPEFKTQELYDLKVHGFLNHKYVIEVKAECYYDKNVNTKYYLYIYYDSKKSATKLTNNQREHLIKFINYLELSTVQNNIKKFRKQQYVYLILVSIILIFIIFLVQIYN
ncbi:hypothetical protein [Clostridium mediterraneense]|uniref:hypothetical protein n=1 Tax=Clostridium mediterraneense TaxID=1805472 RepID=UPI000836C8BF|nr:hypothetical protein [Clostridium mediterraneense]